eukprot:TRINITY_DN7133_c0_g1_i1.p1 TRINITY_DN7133_c0_g1~~TRINITY_DN7133_c0_g1_i1.p1  ORF type:complete len:236 (+),score=44.74 TRINITY_DN7133_c0_g1_i1:58-708(+)
MADNGNGGLVETDEKLFKVLIIGDYATGKTSLLKRYTEGTFSGDYKLSIGVDFSLKSLTVQGEPIQLQLWDIAGHERYRSMTSTYYRYAIAAVVVFDLERPATFNSVAKWHADLNDKVMLANGDSVPAILLANKADQAIDAVDEAQLDRYCSQHNFIGWFATSAKTGQNVSEAFEALAERIVEVSKGTSSKRPEGTVKLEQEPTLQEKMKASCCAT